MPDASTSAEFGSESYVKCIGVYNPKDVFLLNGGIDTLAKAVNKGTELELNDQKYELRYILCVPSEGSMLESHINFTLRATGEEPCTRIIRPGEQKFRIKLMPIKCEGQYYRCTRCDRLNSELIKTNRRRGKVTSEYETPHIASSYSTGGPSYAGEESDDG